MMKRLLPNVLLLPAVSALLALASCATSAPAATTRPAIVRRAPAEDLSKYRPVFTAPAHGAGGRHHRRSQEEQ